MKLLNLTVLQRIDPFVGEILFTATHVTFYEFNVDLTQWSRKDVEGSLFVVKRNTQPRFQFIVMNRRNTENLVENLLGDFEYEVQVPYLLYRNAAQEVNGIWFYNARECEEVANLFNRILNAYNKAPQKSKVSPAKSEFEELEAVPTMAVMDGPLEPPSSNASNIADVPTDPSFVNFFNTAMTIGKVSNAAIPYQSCATPFHPPSVASPPLSTSTPLTHTPESNSRINHLVRPSSFYIPSALTIVRPPVSEERLHGAPLLQPFPPPTPPPSLTPAPTYGPLINRDKVKEALLVLAQDNQFIDMVYRVLLNAYHS